MTFNEVVALLRQAHPDAEMGATALHGEWFNRAQGMTFSESQEYDDTYEAPSIEGRTMYLYYSERYNRICCGDKEL